MSHIFCLLHTSRWKNLFINRTFSKYLHCNFESETAINMLNRVNRHIVNSSRPITTIKKLYNNFEGNRQASIPMLIRQNSYFRNIRTMTTTKQSWNNYEGDGKTTVTMLNRDNRHLIMIDSVSDHGFRLNNGIFVCGPIAVFPRTVLQWNASSVEDITPETLSLFTLLEPKLDLFIIGTGENSLPLQKETLKFLRDKKINVEVLRTEHACSTFNFLNVEGRCVAAAVLPPSHVAQYQEEMKLVTGGTGFNTGDGGYIM